MSRFAVDYVDGHMELRLYENLPQELGRILEIGLITCYEDPHLPNPRRVLEIRELVDELIESGE